MADKSNKEFWRALKELIKNAKDSNPNPITTDMVVKYDIETGEVTAERVGGTRNPGGGTSYPP